MNKKAEVKESTELAVMPVEQRAKLAVKADDKGLIELAGKSKQVTQVTNASEREESHNFLMTLKKARTAITAIAKEARDDANKFQSAVIVEEKRLIALIQPEEVRLQTLRDTFDAAEEAERQRKANEILEAARILEEKMNALEPGLKFGDTSAVIRERLQAILSHDIDESYGELQDKASLKKLDTLSVLESALANALHNENMAAQNAELLRKENERKAEEEKQAELKRVADQKIFDEQQAEVNRQSEANAAEAKRLKDIDDEQKRQQEAKDAETKRQQEEQAAEAHRIATLPDKEKLLEFAATLKALPIPVLATEAGQHIAEGSLSSLNTLAKRIAEAAEAL